VGRGRPQWGPLRLSERPTTAHGSTHTTPFNPPLANGGEWTEGGGAGDVSPRAPQGLRLGSVCEDRPGGCGGPAAANRVECVVDVAGYDRESRSLKFTV